MIEEEVSEVIAVCKAKEFKLSLMVERRNHDWSYRDQLQALYTDTSAEKTETPAVSWEPPGIL